VQDIFANDPVKHRAADEQESPREKAKGAYVFKPLDSPSGRNISPRSGPREKGVEQ
jgi:hypothetical protein